MAKVLLVEDDNNLREIFEMRLQAEGYETMTAADGEEALVVAMKQKPDLIIADVMMPKLSGFEMLETLRATPEMGNTKVIMMTALGQAEDRTRGEKLGVVKYLVKSQVTLEDFVRVVQEVLQPGGEAKGQQGSPDDKQTKTVPKNNDNIESEQSMQDDSNAPTNPSAPADGAAPPNPMGGDSSSTAPAGGQSSADEQATVQNQINDFVGGAPSTPAEPPADAPMPPAGDPAPMGGAPDAGSTPAEPPADGATPGV